MPPPLEHKTWTRSHGDHQYRCTTDPSPIDLSALNAALDSAMVWWAGPLSDTGLRTMVDHSLCLSVYCHANNEQGGPGAPPNPMIGFGRLITDYVTFAYLTDVYVLPEHRSRGLAVWMMECLDEVLREWPALRRLMLVASDERVTRMYERVLGMKKVDGDGESKSKSGIMVKVGPGASTRMREMQP